MDTPEPCIHPTPLRVGSFVGVREGDTGTMAYVDGFEHDIFVSYARVNDLAVSETDEGWVTAFLKYFEKELAERVGRMGIVKIWRDVRRIEGNDLFDRTIEDAINASAVFVALTSNGYLESKYCLKELAFFHRKASNEPLGLAIDDKLRILNVGLNNVPQDRWPEEFGRTSGFILNDAEGDSFGQPSEPGGHCSSNSSGRWPMRSTIS